MLPGLWALAPPSPAPHACADPCPVRASVHLLRVGACRPSDTGGQMRSAGLGKAAGPGGRGAGAFQEPRGFEAAPAGGGRAGPPSRLCSVLRVSIPVQPLCVAWGRPGCWTRRGPPHPLPGPQAAPRQQASVLFLADAHHRAADGGPGYQHRWRQGLYTLQRGRRGEEPWPPQGPLSQHPCLFSKRLSQF